MTVKSTSRVQLYRQRMRDAGLKELRGIFASPEDEQAVKQYAAGLQRRRKRKQK